MFKTSSYFSHRSLGSFIKNIKMQLFSILFPKNQRPSWILRVAQVCQLSVSQIFKQYDHVKKKTSKMLQTSLRDPVCLPSFCMQETVELNGQLEIYCRYTHYALQLNVPYVLKCEKQKKAPSSQKKQDRGQKRKNMNLTHKKWARTCFRNGEHLLPRIRKSGMLA